jgi:hypothetical protein
VVAECVNLLEGRTVDEELLCVLAGPAAESVMNGREGGLAGYWPRVWAVRGLLHAFDETATPALIRAGADESWRVREMVAKVVAAHRVSELATVMWACSNDSVPRVRHAAEWALARLVDS